MLPAGMPNPIEVEKRVQRLETAVIVLGATTAGLAAMLAASRFGTLRARVVEAERVCVTRRSASVMQTLGVRRRAPAGELCVRGGRPELRLLDGHVALMDANGVVRAQLDGSFRPAAAVKAPSHAATRGHAAMRPFAQRPLLLLSDEDGAPTAFFEARAGVRAAPGRGGEGDAASGSNNIGDDDEQEASLAAWAEPLLQAGSTPPGGVADKPSWKSDRRGDD